MSIKNLTVLSEVRRLAGVKCHTPHKARHAMGRHLMEKTGNNFSRLWGVGKDKSALVG